MTEADAERAIRRVLAEYCQFCDDGQFDALVSRFADGGTFRFGRTVVSGHAELRVWFEQMQPPAERGKHLTTNSIIDIDGDTAAVVSDFVFYGLENGSLTVRTMGRYLDTLRLTGEGWRIETRVAKAFRAA